MMESEHGGLGNKRGADTPHPLRTRIRVIRAIRGSILFLSAPLRPLRLIFFLFSTADDTEGC